MKPLDQMTDQELVDHLELMNKAIAEMVREGSRIYGEQARRARPRWRHTRDPDQLDRDEYVEEMSLGGEIYKP